MSSYIFCSSIISFNFFTVISISLFLVPRPIVNLSDDFPQSFPSASITYELVSPDKFLQASPRKRLQLHQVVLQQTQHLNL